MNRSWVHVIYTLGGAFVFHLAAIHTSYGTLRLEWPFYLACIYAIRNHSSWKNGSLLLGTSLFFDALDNQFSNSPAHFIVFMIIRRFRATVGFSRMPGGLVLGIVVAIIDRLLFGFLYTWKYDLPVGDAVRAILDPSYLLTVLVLSARLILRRE